MFNLVFNFVAAKCPGLTPFPSHIVKDLQDARSAVERGKSSSIHEPPSPEHIKEEKDNARKKSVKDRALKNKNAVYRGDKKVKTAVDLDFGNILSDDNSDMDN